MEINNLLDLPAHPLLVHLPVILVPLAFVGAVVVAIRPSWRRRFAIPVAIIAAIAALGVWLAAQSGEALEERVRESDQIEDHATAGENAELPAAGFAVLAIGLAAVDVVDRRQRRAAEPAGVSDAGGTVAVAERTSAQPTTLSKVVLPLAIVTAVVGAYASYTVFEAGHSGAKAVWEDVATHPEAGSDAAREAKGGTPEREADEGGERGGEGDGD